MTTLGSLLSQRAAVQPEKVFLFYSNLEVTYRQLEERTNALARGLAGFKIKRGDPVALLLPNIPEFLYAFFALAKLGAVAVPINTNLKAAEIGYILRDSGARGLVATRFLFESLLGVRESLPDLSEVFLVAEGIGGLRWKNPVRSFTALLSHRGNPFEEEARPQDTAALIYTSGTTGKPKGVILTHQNYLVDTEMFVRAIKMTEADRFACILPLFHVNGQVVTTLSPLFAGAAVILLEKFSPKDFLPAVAQYRATSFSAVPTVYAILLSRFNPGEHDLSSLRYCICGGAPMPVEVFEKFEKSFNATILEGYGLSEGTCVSSVNPVEGRRKVGSIGLPLEGQEMRVVDDSGQEVAAGEVGEIVIRGPNVMRGYHNNPEATAEALRNGWLHSGDLGMKDQDGYFYVVGRKKEMIIRGGENIYPKEIEEILYCHPAILEAAVIGKPDPIWGEEVVAFIVLKEGAALSEAQVIDYCRESLADFKAPRRVFFEKSLPKTATGKIQKVRLREERFGP